MSGNYDYPPASSRRPSRPSGPEPPIPESLPQRVQRIIDALSERDDEPELDSEQNNSHGVFRTSLHQILDDLAPDLIAQSIHEGLETPREIHSSPPRPSRDSLLYLRNLLHSESNNSNPDDTDRALQTLNQEIEEHRLDTARQLTHAEQSRATVQQQLQQLASDVTNPSRRYTSSRGISDRLRPERTTSTLSPASSTQEPRSTNRLIRRRSFRADFRGIDPSTLTAPIPTPSLMPQSAQTSRSGRDGRGRLKRRKLDTDDNREGMRGFNYGQYGQVVPGALKMELASCDGGIYDPDGDCSFPENILRNDNSVYCTKSDRCNLVLRHQGEAPFCLKKLVIKAPRNGYDSPIQEGMVFVSMTSDELLARTARYQIQYSSVHRRQHRRRMQALPSQEYLNSYRAPLQSLERTVLTGPNALPTNNETPEPLASTPHSEFRITTDYNESSEDSVFHDQDDSNEDVAELERLENEEDPLCSDSDESFSEDGNEEEEEERTGLTDNNRRLRELSRRAGFMRGGWSGSEPRRQGQPSLIDPIPPPPVGSGSGSGSGAGLGGASGAEVMKPHARFFIEREKSMVSIKFDPPPSGRFILIKLWSPRNADNIDIQSIIAHGYAGPRFFPSGGFR
ncbi:unnamed protein product [Penicillium manginii]